MRARHLLALAAALALADASIVTLALPSILDELDASVEGVAAVIGVYTLVVALALLPAEALRRRWGSRALGTAGLLLFASASVGCGLAGTLTALLAFRGAQALGAAVALVAIFDLIGRSPDGTASRAWTAAAVFGIAVGPVLGGALTQAFDWRAIFLVQAPVIAIAAVAAWRAPALHEDVPAAAVQAPEANTEWLPPTTTQPVPAGRDSARASYGAGAPRPAPGTAPSRRAQVGPALSLALVSAALTAVLFLLVLLLVTGWSLSPLAAAATVTVVPVAALAGTRIRGGDARTRACIGAGLIGAGVLTLAFLPDASVVWTLAPQALAGVGMGLSIPALAGHLLPERTPAEAARLLAVRHAGITIALAVLAPVAAAQLDDAVADTRERGAALVLDARLPPLTKLDLAGVVVADLSPVDPRDSLEAAFAANAPMFDGEARPAYDELTRRADEVLIAGVDGAFELPFLICGALALLGALAVVPRPGRRLGVAAAVTAGALLLPVGQALARPQLEPEPVTIQDPCRPDRDLPKSGGLAGVVQDAALVALDRAACRFGSSREELALAIADEARANAYQRRYGEDPRSAVGLLGGLLGL